MLVMFSGSVIAAIGVLLYRVLKLTPNRLAIWIPIVRAFECVVVITFGIYLLTNSHAVPNHLLVDILADAPVHGQDGVVGTAGDRLPVGRCFSTACTDPSAVRCATRNSPVTSVAGLMSRASSTCGNKERWTHSAVGCAAVNASSRTLRTSLATPVRVVGPVFLAQLVVPLDGQVPGIGVRHQGGERSATSSS